MIEAMVIARDGLVRRMQVSDPAPPRLDLPKFVPFSAISTTDIVFGLEFSGLSKPSIQRFDRVGRIGELLIYEEMKGGEDGLDS